MAYVDVKFAHLLQEHDRIGFLQSLAEFCASAVDAERCTFSLAHHLRGELRAKVALRTGAEIVLRLGQGLAGHCAASGETIKAPAA